MKQRRNYFIVLSIFLLSFTSCTTKRDAVPITFGKDQCAYCKMTISNPKFGAELITNKGRIFKYDAAECLINHLSGESPSYQKLFVVPYDRPKELHEIENVFFLVSPEFRSPMGANLAAFSDQKSVPEEHQNELLNWSALLKTFK